jgi:citrate lyase subunit beta/citryl-CoA lyase
MIETAIGLDQIQSIANSNQVLRLALGNLDLQADLGMQCDEQESQLNYARYQIVLASRLAQIAPPIDGVTPSTDDIARIQADALRAKQLGFGGKLCIHPKQVNAVKAVFAPSLSEIEWAKKVIKASQEAGGGAVRVDGKMVDHPVVVIAERILSHTDKG